MNPVHWDLGEGLVVRTVTLDDDHELFTLVERNRDRLHPWMPWEPGTKSAADTRAFIERSLASEHDVEGLGLWVDSQLVGMMGMRVDTSDAKGEFGYWIDRDAEGMGIVTRASQRLLAFAFDELGLHRVELEAAVENARSRAVAEALGMTLEGVAREAARLPGGSTDIAHYGMLDREWQAARKP